MSKKISKKKLAEAEFVRAIDKHSKVNYCLLCGKKMTSACNSHVVPQFILKEIAENGEVSYGYALQTIEINGLDKTKGIKNAYTFRLICNDCDKESFANYENPDLLFNFQNLDIDKQIAILSEMAIKTRLSHISMKYRQYVTKNLSTNWQLSRLEEEHNFISYEKADIEEHKYQIKKIRKTVKDNRNPFIVLYNKSLDYKTKLATQTIINYNFDLEFNHIYDWLDASKENKGRFFYLMILPYKEQTQILFYVEKEFCNKVEPLINQFMKLSDDEKLQFLFVSLVVHDQQFYMAPSFASKIFKKDKKIVKLYCETESDLFETYRIKDFRKYTNYLLKKYNE